MTFIIKRDRQRDFLFAPLQSANGRELQQRFGLDPQRLETFVLIEGRRAYTGSTAALRIARRLGWPWRLLYALIIVPPLVRNLLYGWLARRRYRWFGKRDQCMVPAEDLRERFLTD